MDQNPYSFQALRVVSNKFPDSNVADIIRATIREQPEGKYDWDFCQLSKEQQEKEISNQKKIFAEIYKRLVLYVNSYATELSRAPKEFVYDCLFRVIFETTDLNEIEQKFSQTQRRDYQLLIINFIEEAKKETKPKKNWVPLKMTMAMFFIALSLFFCINGWQRKVQTNVQPPQINHQILGVETQDNSIEIPLFLIISTPSVNINTIIQPLGVTPGGNMDVPDDITKVSWFNLGPRPGEKGNAIIAGHFNGPNDKEGVFASLNKLKAGDKLFVGGSKGTLITFKVTDSHIYDPGYAEEVFSSSDNGAHLNLITCDGVWDGIKKSYSQRLVVFADISK